MYQRLQNTLYPKDGRFCDNSLLKLLIGSQPIKEGYFLCVRRGSHSINLDNVMNSLPKSATCGDKGYFAADGTSFIAIKIV